MKLGDEGSLYLNLLQTVVVLLVRVTSRLRIFKLVTLELRDLLVQLADELAVHHDLVLQFRPLVVEDGVHFSILVELFLFNGDCLVEQVTLALLLLDILALLVNLLLLHLMSLLRRIPRVFDVRLLDDKFVSFALPLDGDFLSVGKLLRQIVHLLVDDSNGLSDAFMLLLALIKLRALGVDRLFKMSKLVLILYLGLAHLVLGLVALLDLELYKLDVFDGSLDHLDCVIKGHFLLLFDLNSLRFLALKNSLVVLKLSLFLFLRVLFLAGVEDLLANIVGLILLSLDLSKELALLLFKFG